VLTIFAPAQVRARFFLTWVLSWILLGILLAIALASAGPMFLGDMRLAGAQHYKGLVEALKATPVADKVHAYLWDLYQHGETRLGGGISAAPSLHVAMAWLYVLTTWRWWKPLSLPAIAFFAVICVGSVFLGYHYAVDGLISIAGVSTIWMLVGRWVDGHKLTLAHWGFAPMPKPAGE
jgi:membrane-associated phospholipid phosphatase